MNHEYVDKEIIHLKELRIADAKAIELARTQMEARLEGMNEFRAQLKDQSNTFVTLTAYNLEQKSMSAKLDLIQDNFRRELEVIKNDFQRSTEIHSKTDELEVENLKKEIQVERELRKVLEGSINTWKWLIGFIGFSGIIGIIILLTR